MSGNEVVYIISAQVLLTPQVTNALQRVDIHLLEILLEIDACI